MILLDTHAVLWFVGGSPELSAAARNAIENEADVRVSVASLWEIAIKLSTGKLSITLGFDGLIVDLTNNAIAILPLEVPHLRHILTLPPHHRDPFDRVIIAQALCEGVTLVTRDPLFLPYGVSVLW